MKILTPCEFDVHFQELNLRESIYADYCNYLVLYAQTYKEPKSTKRWVRYKEIPRKYGSAYKEKVVEVSDDLQKLIEQFYGVGCKGITHE